MKKVFNKSSDVIHLFANQLQEEAKCSNVSFYNNKIYSYSTVIGTLLNDDAILLNDHRYSSPTSKQQSELRQATRHLKQFFTSETDLKTVLYSIRENVEALQRAKKPLKYIDNSLYLFEKLNLFIDFNNDATIKNKIEYKEIETLIEAIKTDPKNSKEALNRFNEQKAKLQKEAEAKELKERIKLFRTYKISHLRVGNKDFLRLSKDKQYIETSQGVTITTDEAKRLLSLLDSNNIVGANVDNKYIVKSFNKLLVVGCHNVPLSEINKVRKLIQ